MIHFTQYKWLKLLFRRKGLISLLLLSDILVILIIKFSHDVFLFGIPNQKMSIYQQIGCYHSFVMSQNIIKSVKNKLHVTNNNIVDIGACTLYKVHNAFGHDVDVFYPDFDVPFVYLYYFFKKSAVISVTGITWVVWIYYQFFFFFLVFCQKYTITTLNKPIYLVTFCF